MISARVPWNYAKSTDCIVKDGTYSSFTPKEKAHFTISDENYIGSQSKAINYKATSEAVKKYEAIIING